MDMSASEDSDQPVRLRSLVVIFTGRSLDINDAKFLYADNEDSDQTARMRRLI